MIALGIDAGASSSRWLLLDDGVEIARGRAEPITGHVFTAEERARTLERVSTLCEAVASHARPDRVAAGITGLGGGGEAASVLAGALAAALDIDPRLVWVMNDMDVAYRAVFAPGEGVLVYGGTGSIAYHVPNAPEPGGDARDSATGTPELGSSNAPTPAAAVSAPLRVGGHGYLIDDAGGGYWIGRRALQEVLRDMDRIGRPPDTPLSRAVFAHVGGSTWGLVRQHVYGGGRAAVAALAAVVAETAREGDGASAAILADAGRELARLALVAFERLGGHLPVRLAGGVVHMGKPLVSSFRRALPEGLDVEPAAFEPVEAAARLARDAG